jgi:DNA-binding NarL/FixJ family response regulator
VQPPSQFAVVTLSRDGSPVEPYSVLVADREPLVRLGLRVLLGEDRRLTVIGEARTATEVLDDSRRLKPDLLFVDAGLPGLDGLAATGALYEASPHTRVLVLCDDATPARDCLARVSGAAGWVPRSVRRNGLRRAVTEALATGDAGRASAVDMGAAAAQDAIGSLSARELEVLALVSQGCSNSQIAQLLTISPSTAKSHVEHILRKLGVKSRTAAAVKAARLGLVGTPAEPSTPEPAFRSAVA